MKKILITGVTGQDGSHMADYLLNKNLGFVVGGIRRLSVSNHQNIEHLKGHPRFKLIDLDITDPENTSSVISEEQPDYFINFAANSFVGNSWKMPVNHMETNCMSVLYQLESIKKHCRACRYYNAGSSEEFGDVISCPQNETHPPRPRSIYGASKVSARQIVKVYRDSYDMYAVQGWLFNHEGVRRGADFVTRKISRGVASIKIAIEQNEPIKTLSLGNIDAKRDWSDAEDFIDGVWLMLNQDKPKDYVLSSGRTHSIRDFVEECLLNAEIGHYWSGSNLLEKCTHSTNGSTLIDINKDFYRPAEVDILHGDSSLAEKELGWVRKSDFKLLVKKMYQNDYSQLLKKL
jgi:GDPmannose 4,6-dehydratase